MESVVEGINGGGDAEIWTLAEVDTDGCEAEKCTQVEAGDCDHNGLAEVTEKPLSRSVKQKRSKRLHLSDAAHRRRLMRLLVNSVRLQKWKVAGLALCPLMGGSNKGAQRGDSRKKYWAAMEILSQINKDFIYPFKIKCVYEAWMSTTTGRSKKLMKKKYRIQLEYVLFLLSLGSISEAYDSIKFLVLDSESGSDPLVNLVAGLICYQLWYQGIPKEMQLTDSATQTQSEIEKFGFQQDQNIRHEIFPSSYYRDTESSYKTKTIDHHVSDGSIGNERKKSMEVYYSVPDHPQVPPAGGFYVMDHANLSMDNVMLSELEQIDGFQPFPLGWNINLFPIQLVPSTNIIDTCHQLSEGTNKELYLNAVNYLRVATYSSPPLLPALVPFVQLLLLGGQVEETLIELKNFCYSSNAVLPNRLRTSLLECVGSINLPTLTASYEYILEKDPTCRKSLLSLISLHKNGRYKSDRLINMIALHLDATFAAHDIWEEFATCFLNLQTENSFFDDQMSTDQYITDNKEHFPSCGTVHQSFVKDGARRSWKLRCKWWSQRHFSEKACLEELQNGDLELITFKAASAVHIFEPKFYYVQNVYSYFKDGSNRDKILLLDKHFENSTKLARYLSRHGKL